jgi:uncharacterized protein (DUF488 family)
MEPVRTLGHGTLAEDEFLAIVRDAGVEAIVDVRRFPGSRRSPQYSVDGMATWLAGHGIEYHWLAALGGRRKPSTESPNQGLRNEQFRAYADHMTSDEFADGIFELCALMQTRRLAVMCAESAWWRCHRRLLADHLVLVEETPVEHLFHDGRLVAHVPMPEAHRLNDHLVYLSSQPASSMPASRK